MVVKRRGSSTPEGYCAAAISIPRTCSTEIIPRALVNEKCVSAFEFSRIMRDRHLDQVAAPWGNAAAHSSFKVLGSRGFPASANFAIAARYGSSASERLPARRPPT